MGFKTRFGVKTTATMAQRVTTHMVTTLASQTRDGIQNKVAAMTVATLTTRVTTHMVTTLAAQTPDEIQNWSDDDGYIDTDGVRWQGVDTKGDRTKGDDAGGADTWDSKQGWSDGYGYDDTDDGYGGYVDTKGDHDGYVDTKGDHGGDAGDADTYKKSTPAPPTEPRPLHCLKGGKGKGKGKGGNDSKYKVPAGALWQCVRAIKDMGYTIEGLQANTDMGMPDGAELSHNFQSTKKHATRVTQMYKEAKYDKLNSFLRSRDGATLSAHLTQLDEGSNNRYA